jgi:hypothetical protein
MTDPKRRDLRRWTENPRTVAAAVVLQLYGAIEPDYSRDLADRVVHAVDRAGVRQHASGAATEAEVRRAENALHRLGYAVPREDVERVLNETFVFGWVGDV